MALDPKVFGPHYWFFLHTISLNYPKYPNAVTKKKYYDFIQNLPLFIPIEKHATDFSKLLDEYPVSPYLDSRDSFVRWMHFIHNKINEKLEKRKITLSEFYVQYYDAYKPKEVKFSEYYRLREKAIYLVFISLVGSSIYYLYDK
jgi:hypothetical protein